jgi:Protein of unknown function (DUF3800)
MNPSIKKQQFFLDEAGDTTFFGKGKVPVIGTNGVSKSFMIGMLRFRAPLNEVRQQLEVLRQQVLQDPYYKGIASMEKKKQKMGYFFHATDDIPEVRKQVYEFIRGLDIEVEIVVGRKIPSLYVAKHNGKPAEFYADLLSHLINNHLDKDGRAILYVAERGKTTSNHTFDFALKKAEQRYLAKTAKATLTDVIFHKINHTQEPLLNIIDYVLWAVQRLLQTGETRYYDFIKNKIVSVIDLYDNNTVYDTNNPLTTDSML